MKKTIAILIMLVMVLSFAGCAAREKPSEGTGVDLPADFLSWTEVDMVNYMKAEGVFTHEDWIDIQVEAEETPIGITRMIAYIDDYGDADIIIFWLETEGPTPRTEEIYNEIKTTHQYIMTEAGNVPCPFNLLLGRFAILYSTSLDNKLVEKMETAINKLINDYGVEPDFYDKDPKMPTYDEYPDADKFEVDE